MKVIRHHHVGIKFDERTYKRSSQPLFLHNLAETVLPYFAIRNVSENVGPLMGSKGDEIAVGVL